MCGLIYCKRHNSDKSVASMIGKRFRNQKERGTQGFGYVEIKNGIVTGEIRTQTEKEMLEHLTASTAEEILFHHRIPTSTPNFIESTHPIKVSHKSLKYNYYVIHNGIINNDNKLKEKHTKQGFSYNTEIKKKWITTQQTYIETLFNDSESLAIDFCLSLEKKKSMESEGSIAFIALQYEKTTGKAINLFFGRNGGNPLCIESNKEFLAISSESGKEIETDTLYQYNYETTEITSRDYDIGISDYSYKQIGYNTNNYNKQFNWYDYEEDDILSEYDDEIDYLKGQLKLAIEMRDYNEIMSIESQIEELQIMRREDEQKLQLQCNF